MNGTIEIKRTNPRNPSSSTSVMLHACRQTRHEMHPIFFDHTKFRVDKESSTNDFEHIDDNTRKVIQTIVFDNIGERAWLNDSEVETIYTRPSLRCANAECRAHTAHDPIGDQDLEEGGRHMDRILGLRPERV